MKKTNKLSKFQPRKEKILEITDAWQAERAKNETRIPFIDYLKRRWGPTKNDL